MAVAFDSVGPSSAGAGHTGTGVLTWTHTTIGGPCTILVGVSPDNIATSLPATVTCDGAGMTSLGIVASGAGGTTGFAQLFRIDGISSGAHTISVTYDVTAIDCTGGSVAFTGVTGVGTVATNAASANSSTSFITVPSSTAGNIIFAFTGIGNSVTATSAPATSRFVNNLQGAAGAATGNCAGATSPAGGSVTVTWSDASTVAATIAVEVRGAAPATGMAQQVPTALGGLRAASAPGLMLPRQRQDATSYGLGSGPAPYQLGTAQVAGTVTSRVLTITQGSDPGDTLLVLVQGNGNAGTNTAVADSKGNTYVLDGSQSTSPQLYAWRSAGATGGPGGGQTAALLPGDTVTITTGTSNITYTWQVVAVPTAGALDTTSPSVVSATGSISMNLPITPVTDADLLVFVMVDQFGPGCPFVDAPVTLVSAVSITSSAYNAVAYQQLGTGTAGQAQSATFRVAGTSGILRGFAYAFSPIPTTTTWTLAGTASNVSQASGTLNQLTAGGPYLAGSGLTSGAGTSRTATVSTSTNAGDTLLALITTQNTSCGINALTDSKGNVYTLDTQAQVAIPMTTFWRSPGATGGPGGAPTVALTTSDTLTATSDAATGNVEIQLICVPGIGALDIRSSGPANGVSTSPAASITPTVNGDMLVVLLANANAGGAPTINSPYSLVNTYHTGVNPYNTCAWRQLAAGTGSGVAQSFTATIVSSQWYAVQYSFQPAPAGTTWSLAGTASNVSSASGAVVDIGAIAGTASNASAASGAVTGIGVIAGTSASASAASGAITQTLAVAGTAANTSSASGAVTALLAPTATASNTSAATGTLTATLALAGTSAAASSAAGTLTGTLVFAGTASSTSSASGTLTTPGAGWSLLQQVVGSTAAALNTPQINFTTTGGALVAAIFSRSGGQSTGALTSVTDSAGNTWIAGPKGAGSGVAQTRIELWYVINPTAFTWLQGNSATSQDYAWNVQEWGGATAVTFDAGSATYSATASSTTCDTPSVAAAGPTDLVLAAAAYAQTTGTLNSASPWTALTNFDFSTTRSSRAAYYAPAAAASYFAEWLLGVAKACGVLTATFKGSVSGATTIAGTASSTSSASGTLTQLEVISATAASASSASGALTLTGAVAGSAVNASSASGAVTLTATITGAASNVSTASGAVTLTPAVTAGTSVATSSANGTLVALLAIAGSAISASSASGVFVSVTIAGTSSTISSAAGTVALIAVISGSAISSSSASGSLIRVTPIAGSATNTSTGTGAFTAILAIAGTSASVTSATGAWLPLPLAGTASRVSTATGTLVMLLAIAGSATTVSTSAGTLTLTPAVIAGASTATSITSGVLVLLAVTAGSAQSASSAAGTITSLIQLAGSSAATSSGTGGFTAILAFAGTASGLSAATGTITLTPALIAGTAITVSSASGLFGAQVLAGNASNASAATGTVTLTIVISGTAASVSSASGRFVIALAGSAVSVSSASGTFLVFVAGTSVSVSSASGAITATLAIAGSAVTASNASGTWSGAGIAGAAVSLSAANGAMVQIAVIAATAITVSGASGQLVMLLRIAGTAVTASAASGQFGAQTLAGTAANVSAATGAVTRIFVLTGSAVSLSTASGTFGQIAAIAGSATALSAASGQLVALLSITGSAVATSLAIGRFVIAIAGGASSISLARGAFFAVTLIAGMASSHSVATGGLIAFVAPKWPAEFRVSVTAAAPQVTRITVPQGPVTVSTPRAAVTVTVSEE